MSFPFASGSLQGRNEKKIKMVLTMLDLMLRLLLCALSMCHCGAILTASPQPSGMSTCRFQPNSLLVVLIKSSVLFSRSKKTMGSSSSVPWLCRVIKTSFPLFRHLTVTAARTIMQRSCTLLSQWERKPSRRISGHLWPPQRRSGLKPRMASVEGKFSPRKREGEGINYDHPETL